MPKVHDTKKLPRWAQEVLVDQQLVIDKLARELSKKVESIVPTRIIVDPTYYDQRSLYLANDTRIQYTLRPKDLINVHFYEYEHDVIEIAGSSCLVIKPVSSNVIRITTGEW